MIGQSPNVHLFVCVWHQLLCRPRNGVQAWRFRDPTAQRDTRFGGRVIGDGMLGHANRTQLTAVTGETLNRGANKENGARLDVHARGLWERQRSAFFDVRVCHPTRIPTER